MRRIVAFGLFEILVLFPSIALAQGDRPLQVGMHLSSVSVSEFENTDVGVGGRVSWLVREIVGIEGELTFYPSDLGDTVAFSAHRLEGLFGATVGPRLGRLRPFAKLRPGFVRVAAAPEPIACILIFPPPLTCRLAAGNTLFALDVGGGIEFLPHDRAVLRVDIGDRAIRYPAPVIDRDGAVRQETFFSHNLRWQIGVGLRF